MKTPKIAVIVSHPIQHFCPQYSSWSKSDEFSIKIFFASRHGLDEYYDKNFSSKVQWSSLNIDFPHVFLPGSADRALSPNIDYPLLADELNRYQPDVVVVYGYRQPLQRRAIRWARANNLKLLMISDSEMRQHRTFLKKIIKRFILPTVYRKVDVFLSVGDANDHHYRHYGVPDAKIVRCFFPIDTHLFEAAYKRRHDLRISTRHELGIPAHQKVILNVGKHVSWKRQMDIVQASNQMQGTASETTFVLAGTGPEHDQLKAAAKRHGPGGVIFAGFVSPAKLLNYYAASDIYVHTSEKEPHSLAISEAIYMGLPVVVSDRCGSYGPTDDVQIGVNGFVYPCGNVDHFLSALTKINSDDSLASKFSIQSRILGLAHQRLAHRDGLNSAIRALD